MKEKWPGGTGRKTVDEKVRDQFEQRIWEMLFGDRGGYEKFPDIKYDRYEIITGEVKNTLLQVLSAEYYKLPTKNKKSEFIMSVETQSGQKEGVSFAEDVMDRFGQRALENENKEDKVGPIGGCPAILATVLKDPTIKGIIDPDATKHKNAELSNMIKAYQMALVKIIGERMKQGEPFLHMLVSERRTTKNNDIIIAGGMRKQGFPADPRVLRWFQEKLTEKLEGDEIQEVADKPVRVRIAEEGETICGSPVHVSRRKILSDLYQFIKVKVPTELLKDPHNNTVAAIAEIAKDFQQEFPDEQSLREYLEENTTEEDKVRLEGKILKEAMIVSDGDQIESQSDTTVLEDNHIALTKNLALALGVLEGDQLTVTTGDDPRERQFVVAIVKKINGKIPRQPVFNSKSGIESNQEVIITK
jgi:hypothetical protein